MKPWDTDNLAYGGYSARNFRVPFHEYGGYSAFVFSGDAVFQGRAREACQSAVADAFFQAGGSVGAKNDFPVLDKTASGWGDLTAGTRSGGCGAFVANQHLAVERSSAVGGGGFYLDIEGRLRSGLNSRVLRDYGLRTRSYTHWTASSGGRSYAHTFARTAAQDGSILASVRPYGSEAYSASSVVTQSPGSGYVGIAGASSNSAVDAYLARTDNYRSRVSHVQPSGGRWLPAAAVLDRRNEYVVHWVYGGRTYSRAVAHLSSASDGRFLHSRYDIGSDTNGTAFCPAGMHPRGQDGSHVIGSSTGRTLSSINTMAEVRQADRHWCRTDIRYKIAFKGQIHNKCDSSGRNPGSGTSECRPPSGVGDPRDGTFQAFGRINCYHTVIEVSVGTDGTGTCVYPHPLPQCTDPVTRRKRSWTQTELGYYTVGEEFPAAKDGSTRCNERTPARAADFTSDPCVTISLDIYENRTPGEPAAPGVAVSDRTRTATDQMPGWDLGVSAGHFNSASPLLDTTGSDKDPSGCADGTESRGDHGALPASAERTNSQASAPPLRSVNQILGTSISLTGVPAPKAIPPAGIAPPAKISFDKPNILRTYHPQNPARANLKAELANDRNTASASLSLSVNHHPNKKARDWRDAYKAVYDNANRRALADLGGTNPATWTNLNWQYHTPYLRWDNYREDPATTYSASTSSPRDGTGCDLVKAAADGKISVEATRLDYETSSYGKGNIYSTRTPAQRTCKIRRTRTPELNLQYQPPHPTGTDTTKTATFWHINYQPTTTAERHKLAHETEVFAIRASLADSPPVLCYQPGEALVAHVAAKGIDAVNKAVFRNASGFAGGNKKHCYRHPSATQLVSNGKPQPAFAFFDDTAHSAMHSVNVVWQQPSTKIVSKLGSTDDLKMMANTVALEASNAVAYDDATRTSSFYGTYYTFPTDNSVKFPSGWDISGHPTLTLASTFTQHQVQAKDTAAKTPTTHTMVFKFIDCVFGIEDVAFVDNIASPYALLSDPVVISTLLAFL